MLIYHTWEILVGDKVGEFGRCIIIIIAKYLTVAYQNFPCQIFPVYSIYSPCNLI